MRKGLLAAAAAAVALAAGAAGAAGPRDYASVALDILPPGENGGLTFTPNTNDQAKLYDALTPLRGDVTDAALHAYFKQETLGAPARPARVERLGRATILRDSFDVPHVVGRTQTDVEYGAGWATAEDRGLLLGLIRGPARVAALDIPGVDPLGLALSGTTFSPSAQTEAFLARQTALLPRSYRALLQAYVAGINAYYRKTGTPTDPYTTNDVVAAAALIAARFGANGGQEATNAAFLSALQAKFGTDRGRRIFDDLREANDPEAPVSLPGSFPQEPVFSPAPGSVVLDDGSFGVAGISERKSMSNALLVSAKRSATGHPLFVAGPQVGYFFPEFFLEIDLEGGGFRSRGAVFPGVPFVVIGRGPDYVWSATSSQADNVDLFAETLCGGDDVHYLYKGECRAMTTFDAGALRKSGAPNREVVFHETVHGPVQGYARVAGRKVAIALARSTRGRELASTRPFYLLDTQQVRSARQFLQTMAGVEFAFNWFYADSKDIAMFSSGRLPVRAAGTDPALPTDGTGAYDWQGFLTAAQHAQGINPPSGAILNWNNKPAAGVGAADSNWGYGSVQRVRLLADGIAAKPKHTLASVVGAMNAAATQDLRPVALLSTLDGVLAAAPTPRDSQVLDLLNLWSQRGAARLDANGDGKIDDPGAAIMDAAWPRIAKAVLGGVLDSTLLDRLEALHADDDPPGPGGSAYIDGWYGTVDKDLRSLLGKAVQGPFSQHYCGGGDLASCRGALWAAIDAATDELTAKQGADPAAWRSDAAAERIRFTSGILPDTMRWTNRPTFQQVVTFRSHR
ncbi:MAG TPA: penicillin acylase family protein [Gaiellaceae bacterium]|jgi:acyl-homoserine lactone acylase PvdQ